MSVGLSQRQRYALVLDVLTRNGEEALFCGPNSDGLAKRNGNTMSRIAWPGSSTHSTDEVVLGGANANAFLGGFRLWNNYGEVIAQTVRT